MASAIPSGGNYRGVNPDAYQRLLELDNSNQQACITLKDGSTYSGNVDNEGNPDRVGSLVYARGNQYRWLRYEGVFAKGQPNGQGVLVYVNGDVFTGGMENGKPVDGKFVPSNNGYSYTGTLDVREDGSIRMITGKWETEESTVTYLNEKQVCCFCEPCPNSWGATCPPEKDAKCFCIIC